MPAAARPALAAQLAPIAAALPPGSVWRPVHDRHGNLALPGGGRFDDILPETLDGVDFAGRTVLDLGCNFGHYAFLAARRGASSVLGVDIEPRIIDGCRVLAEHHGLGNAAFRAADFLKEPIPGEPFDVVLLVDFLGKGMVRKGRVRPCVEALARLAEAEILTTFHAGYDAADLGLALDDLAEMYPAEFLRPSGNGGRLDLLGYVTALLGPGWRRQVRTTPRAAAHHLKRIVRFRR